MKNLIFYMKKRWYNKIKNGDKLYEVRPVSKHFISRLENRVYDTVEFRCGYTKKPDRIFKRKFNRIEKINKDELYKIIPDYEKKYIDVEYEDTKEFYIIYVDEIVA